MNNLQSVGYRYRGVGPWLCICAEVVDTVYAYSSGVYIYVDNTQESALITEINLSGVE